MTIDRCRRISRYLCTVIAVTGAQNASRCKKPSLAHHLGGKGIFGSSHRPEAKNHLHPTRPIAIQGSRDPHCWLGGCPLKRHGITCNENQRIPLHLCSETSSDAVRHPGQQPLLRMASSPLPPAHCRLLISADKVILFQQLTSYNVSAHFQTVSGKVVFARESGGSNHTWWFDSL